ncbi:MAG: OmpA family protein [Leptospiraceae bacterium]|nr:OmpA family protein [Leptospiraceae bacterium]
MKLIKTSFISILILAFSFSCSSISSRMWKSVGIGCLAGLAAGALADAAKEKANKKDREQLQNKIKNIFSQEKRKPENKGKIVGLGVGCLAGLGVGYYLDTMAEDMEAQLKENGMTVEKIKGKDGETRELLVKAGADSLTFISDKFELTPDSEPKVGKIAEALQGYDETKIRITGHVSAKVKDAFNTKLSQDRADAVKGKLIEQGVSASRISEVKGMANEQPLPGIAPTDPKNRRVEIFITAAE